MTGGRRDESVSVSLRSLMELEEQRVAKERRAAGERAAMEAKRAQDAIAAQALAEQARQREAREAEEERQRTERLEAAKVSAIHQAALEQARLQEDAKSRSVEAERERHHQLEIEHVRAAAAKERQSSRTFVSLSLGVLAGFALSSGLYGGVVRPEAMRRQAELEARLSHTEQAGIALHRSLEQAQAGNARLRAENAKLVAGRDMIAAPVTKAVPVRPPRKGGAAPSTPKRTPKGPGGICADGDPMCDNGRIIR